jgi:hypothetical protein
VLGLKINKMKNIQSKTIWVNGQEKNAVKINVFSQYDDLSIRAVFGYSLLTIDDIELVKGTIDIGGEEYLLWGVATDINLTAYEYVVQKLNLVLA